MPPNADSEGRYRVGQQVTIRDASDQTSEATIAPVPLGWRDWSGSEVVTSKGAFPKAWVHTEGGAVIPWPLEDVAPTARSEA